MAPVRPRRTLALDPDRLREEAAVSTATLDRPRTWRETAATPYGRYALASLGLMAIATANGVTRELVYADALGEEAAHRVSLVPMAFLFGAYVYVLERRWPLPTWRGAVAIGLLWAAIAVGFELGVGRYADGRSWTELLREYDLTAGRSGGLVLVWTVAVPSAVRLVRRRLGRG
jgi:hypothetical protein